MSSWFLLRALAVAAIALWPLIPVFFLQVHSKPSFWIKLGAYTYLVVLLEMLPIMTIVIIFQGLLLGREFAVGSLIALGVLFFVPGVLLNLWTAKLLGWRSLIAYSELKPQVRSMDPVEVGPFTRVRHPTYLAHTLIFVGPFLVTGFAGVGALALIDFVTSYFLIIPLEERELTARFQGAYRRYQKRVPKFYPLKLA
jgi:protein-S-isoprenylcysteine O-methyltransferase Ste14